MSNLPPPSVGPAAGGPDGPWGGLPQGAPGGPVNHPLPYIASPPPSSGRTNRAGIIAAVLAVVAIIGAGAYVLTNDGDDDTEVTVVTEVTDDTIDDTEPTEATEASVVVETDPPESSVAPETTTAPTTTASPTTTSAATTTTIAAPLMTIDLGHNVFIPIPVGWSQTNEEPDSVVTLTDDTTSVAVQALARIPGEAPSTLMQEYIDTFDTDFETVSYGPTANIRRLEGEPAVDVYTTFYITYDAAADFSLSGNVNTYIRGDGLSLIVDVYGPADAAGAFPIDAGDALTVSLQTAPSVDTSVDLVPAAPFRVTSVHPFVQVDGLVGFTTAPGFSVVASGDGRGFVTNDTEDFQVDKVPSQPDTNAVGAAALAVVAQNYTGVTSTELVLGDPDPFGVVHGSFSWTGTYLGGNPSAGAVDFYYDPATQNAYIVFRTWFTGADNNEPFPAHAQFMLQSVFNSFTTIP